MQNFLFHIANTLLVSGAFYLLYRSSQKRVPVSENGFYVLRMPHAYLYGGMVSFLLGLAGIAIPFAANDFSLSVLLSSFGVFVILGGIGFFMIMLSRNHFVRFNQELMVVQNAWGHSTTVFYHAIQSARYNSLTGAVKISHTSGRDVHIHEHLVGYPQIMDQIRQVNPKAMIQVRQGFP